MHTCTHAHIYTILYPTNTLYKYTYAYTYTYTYTFTYTNTYEKAMERDTYTYTYRNLEHISFCMCVMCSTHVLRLKIQQFVLAQRKHRTYQ
jgi:hypothetical protein